MFSLHHWLAQQHPIKNAQHFSLHPLKGDASFRRYYRVKLKKNTYIAVHSPPQTENNTSFISVAEAFLTQGLYVPKVLSHDLDKGFLLLSDLGDNVLYRRLTSNKIQSNEVDLLYSRAMDELAKIQLSTLKLPNFDAAFMRNECDNFKFWTVNKYLNFYQLSKSTKKMIDNTINLLLHSAVEQPQCPIHRDYHSRNLMILNDAPHKNIDATKIGILDFQDAMIGPVTYDLVSLMRDCYIEWPAEQVMQWALDFHQKYLTHLIPDQEKFIKYFDLMGIQRHLKASFIFARKYHRDQTISYLQDIPRTLNYIYTVSRNHTELEDFRNFIGECIHALPQ